MMLAGRSRFHMSVTQPGVATMDLLLMTSAQQPTTEVLPVVEQGVAI